MRRDTLIDSEVWQPVDHRPRFVRYFQNGKLQSGVEEERKQSSGLRTEKRVDESLGKVCARNLLYAAELYKRNGTPIAAKIMATPDQKALRSMYWFEPNKKWRMLSMVVRIGRLSN